MGLLARRWWPPRRAFDLLFISQFHQTNEDVNDSMGAQACMGSSVFLDKTVV
jgi:hypothetical protein